MPDVRRWIASWPGILTLGGSAVGIALAGGAISGHLEHLPHPAAAAAATSTTSTTLEPAAAVRADVVRDMTLDIAARRMDVNVATRHAAAVSPAEVAARHANVAAAWAADRVATVQAQYDGDVPAAAADPTQPSFTGGRFVAVRWVAVNVTGATAAVTVVGHDVLDEPGNRAAPGGQVTNPDWTWQLTLSWSGTHWLIETRSGTASAGAAPQPPPSP